MSLTHNLLSYDNNTETFQNNFLYNQDQTQYGAGIVSKIGSKIGSVGKGLNSGLNAVAHHKDILKFSKRSTTDKVDMAAKMIDQVRHKLQKVIFYFEKVILILSKFKLPLKNAKIRTFILIIPRLLILITGLFILFSGIFGVKKSTKVAAYDIVKIFILIITFLFLTFTYTDFDPSKKTSKTKPDTLIIFIRMFFLSLPYVYPLLSSFFVLIVSVSVLRIDGKISLFFTKIFNLFIFLCLVIFTLVASIFTLFKRDVYDDACLDKNLKYNETASDHCNMYKSKKIFSVLMLYIIWYTIYSALEFIVVDTIHFWLKFFGIMKSNDKPNFIMYIMMGIQLLGTILIGGGLVVLQMIPIPPIVSLNGTIGTSITKFTSLLDSKLDDIVNMVKKYREERIIKKQKKLSSNNISISERLTSFYKSKKTISEERVKNHEQLVNANQDIFNITSIPEQEQKTPEENKQEQKQEQKTPEQKKQEKQEKQAKEAKYEAINKEYQEKLYKLKNNRDKDPEIIKKLSDELDKVDQERNKVYNELQNPTQNTTPNKIDITYNIDTVKNLFINNLNIIFRKLNKTKISQIEQKINNTKNKKIPEGLNESKINKLMLEKNNNLYKLLTNYYLNNKSLIDKIIYQFDILNDKNKNKNIDKNIDIDIYKDISIENIMNIINFFIFIKSNYEELFEKINNPKNIDNTEYVGQNNENYGKVLKQLSLSKENKVIDEKYKQFISLYKDQLDNIIKKFNNIQEIIQSKTQKV